MQRPAAAVTGEAWYTPRHTPAVARPFGAALVNRALLARFRQPAGAAVPFLQRYGIFLLLPAALPLSLQLAGALWSAVTALITFTDLRM